MWNLISGLRRIPLEPYGHAEVLAEQEVEVQKEYL
jgi:hypothetical protein